MGKLKTLTLAIAALGLALQGVMATAQAPMPAAQPTAPVAPPSKSALLEGYNIGPDDVIEIDLLGQPDFKTRARVKADGTIPLPYLGTINVNGKTTTTLADDVAQRLRAGGFYARPIVNVEIASFASRYVIVLGDVASPGLMPVDRAYRVSEVIARAGGIRESGADSVVVRRESGEELKLAFEKLARGDAADDPFVQPGDKVFVPPADLYYIYGQINAPGAYPLKNAMSLRKAIARGGGITPSGSEKRIKIYRDGVPQPVELERNIQPGDVIVVGERLF